MFLYETTTLYEVLGVTPAATQLQIGETYRRKLLVMLDEHWSARSSSRQTQECREIAKLTAACHVLLHGDRRKAYDDLLRTKGLICPLCDGKGYIDNGHMTGPQCGACEGTGRGWDFNAEPLRCIHTLAKRLSSFSNSSAEKSEQQFDVVGNFFKGDNVDG